MYLRLVQANIHPERIFEIKKMYDEKVIPILQRMKGCLSVNLIHSEVHPGEIISMTLWEKKEDTDAYERSGIFQQLLEEARPFLAGSSEWKIQLSEDFKIEYQPVQEEPVIKTYDLAADSTNEVLGDKAKPIYVRIVTPHVRREAREEFKSIYNSEVLSQLRQVHGCRYAALTENVQAPDQFVSITVWNSKEDADAYEQGGLFHQLGKKLRHTFSEAYQWKMRLERETGRKTISTEDMDVEGYSIVTGQTFS